MYEAVILSDGNSCELNWDLASMKIEHGVKQSEDPFTPWKHAVYLSRIFPPWMRAAGKRTRTKSIGTRRSRGSLNQGRFEQRGPTLKVSGRGAHVNRHNMVYRSGRSRKVKAEVRRAGPSCSRNPRKHLRCGHQRIGASIHIPHEESHYQEGSLESTGT
jgi:hypothetical protein